MSEELVKLEIYSGVAILTMNRLGAHNSMNDNLLEEFASQTARIADDDQIRAVVIAGGERFFSVGGDLHWIAAHPDGPSAAVHALAGRLHESIVSLRRMPKPVIAAVRGMAAGAGMSLALACDLRVMADDAFFLHAYTSRGFSVDGGLSYSLPRLVGLGRAFEIIAFDEPINAAKAREWGLVNRTVVAQSVIPEAMSMANKLAARPVHGFGLAKKLLTDSFGINLESQLELEREALKRSLAHKEGINGLSDFIDDQER